MMSLSLRLEGIARLYNNLFTLPSSPLVFTLTILAHAAIGSLLFSLQYPLCGLTGAMDGVLWGLASLLPASLTSIPFSAIAANGKVSVWSLRRLTGLSFFSLVFWGLPALLGVALHTYLPDAPILGLVLGLGLMSFLRMLVFRGVSYLSFVRSFVSSSTQPLLMVAALILSNFIHLSPTLLVVFVAAWVLLAAVGYLYLHIIDKTVERELGVGGLRLLYGFMAEWLSEESQPLEEVLAELGSVEEHKVLVLSFVGQGKPAASIIVPMVHPGPFRKVGGATLPHIVASIFEDQVGGLVGVAHGASTHAQNPVSRSESVRLANEVVEAVRSSSLKPGRPVSTLIHVERRSVRVGCQLFGDLALFTLSLTPCGYDDVHPSVLTKLSKSLEDEWGGKVFLIDAHSASEGGLELDPLTPDAELVEELIAAASEALKKAKTLAVSRSVKAGGGRASVKGAGLKEGIGSGGVFSLLVEVEGHVACYIIVDGNNMVPGLREAIKRKVEELGVQAVEVLTSDSHETNAISLGERGSNPVGLSIDWDAVIEAVLESVADAKENLTETEPMYSIREVRLKVIGESSMAKLSSSMHRAVSLAKKAAIIPLLSLLALTLFFL
ncbi:MAG: DUF2070 family protein [Candidatus Freyarchaeota archaeon]|nr:DUF2070 family protein [Candidatus Jordarchaeia archaeon]